MRDSHIHHPDMPAHQVDFKHNIAKLSILYIPFILSTNSQSPHRTIIALTSNLPFDAPPIPPNLVDAFMLLMLFTLLFI